MLSHYFSTVSAEAYHKTSFSIPCLCTHIHRAMQYAPRFFSNKIICCVNFFSDSSHKIMQKLHHIHFDSCLMSILSLKYLWTFSTVTIQHHTTHFRNCFWNMIFVCCNSKTFLKISDRTDAFRNCCINNTGHLWIHG